MVVILIRYNRTLAAPQKNSTKNQKKSLSPYGGIAFH
jgi:hypothetical protein